MYSQPHTEIYLINNKPDFSMSEIFSETAFQSKSHIVSNKGIIICISYVYKMFYFGTVSIASLEGFSINFWILSAV